MQHRKRNTMENSRRRRGGSSDSLSSGLSHSDENENDELEDKTILEGMKHLIDKEKKLMELQLLNKEKELEEMKMKYQAAIKLNETNPHRPSEFDDDEDDDDRYDDDKLEEGYQVDLLRKTEYILNNKDNLKKCKVINLSNCAVNEETIKKLCKQLPYLKNVTTLDLSCNSLGESSAVILSSLLQQKMHLKTLNLSSNRLGAEAIQAIVRALIRNETLESLDLSNNPFHSIPHIGKLIGDALSNNKQLKEVIITISEPKRDVNAKSSKGNTSQFATSVLKSQTINSLSMIYATLPKSCISAISVKIYKILHLNLNYSFIGPSSCVLLCKSLLRSKNGTALSSTFDIKSYSKNLVKTNKKSDSFKSFHNLISLKLCSNSIGLLGCEWIAKVIRFSRTLTHVDISNNLLTYMATESLGHSLMKNQTLLKLDITKNFFGGVEHKSNLSLLNCLKKYNSTLTSLGKSNELYFTIDLKRQLLYHLESKPKIDALQPKQDIEIFTLLQSKCYDNNKVLSYNNTDLSNVAGFLLGFDVYLDLNIDMLFLNKDYIYNIDIKYVRVAWQCRTEKRVHNSENYLPARFASSSNTIGADFKLTCNNNREVKRGKANHGIEVLEENASSDLRLGFVSYCLDIPYNHLCTGDTLQLYLGVPKELVNQLNVNNSSKAVKRIMSNLHINVTCFKVGLIYDRTSDVNVINPVFPSAEINLYSSTPFKAQTTRWA